MLIFYEDNNMCLNNGWSFILKNEQMKNITTGNLKNLMTNT